MDWKQRTSEQKDCEKGLHTSFNAFTRRSDRSSLPQERPDSHENKQISAVLLAYKVTADNES